MPSKKRKFGDIGEKIAEKWLNNKGFSILDRNYLKKWGEIDIVAKKSHIIHFVEVKSVSCETLEKIGNDKNGYRPKTQEVRSTDQNDRFRPEDNVHPAKLKRLHRTIESYLIEKEHILNPEGSDKEGDWQLDVVVVYLDINKKQAKVDILENIVG